MTHTSRYTWGGVGMPMRRPGDHVALCRDEEVPDGYPRA